MKLLIPQLSEKKTTLIYINCNLHAPIQWKVGTLRYFLQWSIMIYSSEIVLEKETNHLRIYFHRKLWLSDSSGKKCY